MRISRDMYQLSLKKRAKRAESLGMTGLTLDYISSVRCFPLENSTDPMGATLVRRNIYMTSDIFAKIYLNTPIRLKR